MRGTRLHAIVSVMEKSRGERATRSGHRVDRRFQLYYLARISRMPRSIFRGPHSPVLRKSERRLYNLPIQAEVEISAGEKEMQEVRHVKPGVSPDIDCFPCYHTISYIQSPTPLVHTLSVIINDDSSLLIYEISWWSHRAHTLTLGLLSLSPLFELFFSFNLFQLISEDQ
jgi:hypothetical protein